MAGKRFFYRVKFLLFLAAVGRMVPLAAETPAPPTLSVTPRLLIEPSSTRHSLALANLIVGPLECKEQVFAGSYQIKVTPFNFKNDHGSLVLNLTDLMARKMSQGAGVEFSGLATSAKDGKTKAIKGKTSPEANDHGAVSFTVTTEDGDLLFNSSYRIVSNRDD